MKAKLAARLREYFTKTRATGLCHQIERDGGPIDLLRKYSFEWPHSVKNGDGSGLDAYFIPAQIGNPSNVDSYWAYNATWQDGRRLRPRLDLANYILKRIAREQKKKFVPIEFDVSTAIK